MACWWLEHSRWLVRAVIRRSLRPPLQLHPQAAGDSSLNGRKNNCARCHVPIPCSLHGNVKDWKNIWVFFAKLRAGLPGIWDAITTRTPLRALCQGLGLSGVPTRGWPWVRGWWCPGPWRTRHLKRLTFFALVNSMAKGEFEEIRDVPYCRCGGTCDDMFPKHQLDLYLPKVALPTRRPVVVFVHGGSWIRGDRRAYRHFFSSYDTNLLVALIMYYYGTYWNVGRAFAKSGIACAVISYRLSRLGFPWVFLELFASMLMSLGIIILPVIMLACFAFGFLALLGFSIAPHWYVQSVASAVILISLIVLWILVCFEDKLYSITFLKKISPFTALTVTGILGLVFDIGRDTFLLHLTACFAVCLSLHFLKFKDRPFVTHPDHITDVALSVRWVKTYGETSGRYNANEIFVCGHSAGGHMVSLLALDKKFLQGVRLSPEDIKVWPPTICYWS